MRQMCLASRWLALLMLVGCSNKPAASIHWQADNPRALEKIAAAFTPWQKILSGFDPATESNEWRVGDRLLLGVLVENDGDRTVRFVLIELKTDVLPDGSDVVILPPGEPIPAESQRNSPTSAPSENSKPGDFTFPPDIAYVSLSANDDPALAGRLPPKDWSSTFTRTDPAFGKLTSVRTSSSVFVSLQVFDDSGSRLSVQGALAPAKYMRAGVLTGCKTLNQISDIAATQPENAKSDPAKDFRMSTAWLDIAALLNGFNEILNGTSSLAKIYQPVVPQPSLLAVILHPNSGVRLELADPVMRQDFRPAAIQIDDMPVDLLLLMLNLFEEPALAVGLTVTDPIPPYYLCGGILGVDCIQAKNPACRLHMRVLAARRGLGS